jgi:hypothetical protein
VTETFIRTSGRMSRTSQAVAAQDFDRPALADQAGRDLNDARIAGAGPGVDLGQQGDLVREGGRGEGIDLVIELLVGGARTPRRSRRRGRIWPGKRCRRRGAWRRPLISLAWAYPAVSPATTRRPKPSLAS